MQAHVITRAGRGAALGHAPGHAVEPVGPRREQGNAASAALSSFTMTKAAPTLLKEGAVARVAHSEPQGHLRAAQKTKGYDADRNSESLFSQQQQKTTSLLVNMCH